MNLYRGFLLLFGIVVWASSVFDGFVNLDTPWLVAHNPILSTGDLSWVSAIFYDMSDGTRLTLGAEYLPVRDLTVLFDFAVFGDSWAWHHAHSIMWYIASSLLFFEILAFLLKDNLAAFFGALVFIAHPVHVESVTWLASRKDVVSLFFFLAGMLVWFKKLDNFKWMMLSVLCVALSTWSKNTGIVLPVVLFSYTLIMRENIIRKWPIWLAFTAVVISSLVISMNLGEQVSMFAQRRGDNIPETVFIEAFVWVKYLGMLFWPVGLSVLYPEPTVSGFNAIWPLIVIGLIVVFALLLIFSRDRNFRVSGFGLVFAAITLLPVSQIVPIQNLIADRYLLLPSAGLILAVVSLLLKLRKSVYLLIPISVSLAIVTNGRIKDWKSPEALWLATCEEVPQLSRAHKSLASVYTAQGRLDMAEKAYLKGINEAGRAPELLEGLALVYLKKQKEDQAEKLLRESLLKNPDRRKTLNYLMLLHMEQGKLEEAKILGDKLTKTHPLYKAGWNNLASVKLMLGDNQGAIEAFSKAVELDPFDPISNCNMAKLTQVFEWKEACYVAKEREKVRRAPLQLREDD